MIDEHVVSLLKPTSFEAEHYRALRHVVEEMQLETGLRILAVTSPGVGDGKTTTAVNLAATLAQRPAARILLIDADLRHGSVAKALGERDSPGLVHGILEPNRALASIVRRVRGSRLAVVPAGGRSDSTYETLTARRLRDLLEEARRDYDCIVIDTPPLLMSADCRVIEPLVDGVLVVVAAHRTPRKLLAEALDLVDPAKARGLVFNGVERRLPGYAAYYSHDSSPANGAPVRARAPRWWGSKVFARAFGRPA